MRRDAVGAGRNEGEGLISLVSGRHEFRLAMGRMTDTNQTFYSTAYRTTSRSIHEPINTSSRTPSVHTSSLEDRRLILPRTMRSARSFRLGKLCASKVSTERVRVRVVAWNLPGGDDDRLVLRRRQCSSTGGRRDEPWPGQVARVASSSTRGSPPSRAQTTIAGTSRSASEGASRVSGPPAR